MNKFKRFSIYLWVVLLIIIDQITKIVIINNIKNNPVVIIKDFLKFTYCENKGVAFSIGDGHVPIFIVINILMICALIFVYEKNNKSFNRLSKIFFTMVIAGGISNLIDRIIRGFVVDFINVNELFQFAIFNVADIFIVLGIFGIAITVIMKERQS